MLMAPPGWPVRVLIANGHAILRAGLRTVLEDDGIEVAGESATAAGVVEAALRLRPHVVLLDVHLPDGSGVEVCTALRAVAPGMRIVFFTDCREQEGLRACLLAGADGYLLKPIESRELSTAIRTVAAGEAISLPHALEPPRAARPGQCPASCGTRKDFAALSPQEHRVLSLVSQGKTNKEIGSAMGLSEKTVKNYLSNVFQKLDIRRRSQAAALFAACQVGLRP